jgi:diphosphomevalonate decarboxylase
VKATAVARANIALTKYWGQEDPERNLPMNDSVSMTLDGLETRTTVLFEAQRERDEVRIGGERPPGPARERVVEHLDRLRAVAGEDAGARVESVNSFPASAGLASSASGFAALTVAAGRALGLTSDPGELSRLARYGSGSASRSLFGGFARWRTGDDESSRAEQIAGPDQWDLRDVILLLDRDPKDVGSSEGHELAHTSPLLEGRLEAVGGWTEDVVEAVRKRDVDALGKPVEADAMAMHAVMMTSDPSLLYWSPGTISAIDAVRSWREEGLSCWFTIDAGPNLHVICEAEEADEVARRAREGLGLDEEDVLVAAPGEGPTIQGVDPLF